MKPSLSSIAAALLWQWTRPSKKTMQRGSSPRRAHRGGGCLLDAMTGAAASMRWPRGVPGCDGPAFDCGDMPMMHLVVSQVDLAAHLGWRGDTKSVDPQTAATTW
eukprot:m.229145 g.229145  ORF g.229145 m.229145 type:complete len:105 (+) comp25993_c1_seq15:3442-3756(+)